MSRERTVVGLRKEVDTNSREGSELDRKGYQECLTNHIIF